MLLHDALALYATLHVEKKYKRPKDKLSLIRRYCYCLPNVGLGELAPEQVIAWHNEITATAPVAANAALSQMRTLYRKMVRWGKYHGINPASAVEPNEEVPRQVVLPDSAIPDVLTALHTRTLPVRLYFLTIMILGYRRDELRCGQWHWMDLASGIYTLPRPKNARPHRLHFPPSLLLGYRQLREETPGPYLFSDTGTAPWSQVRIWRYWNKIRIPLGLREVTVHDLRRTLISYFCNRDEAGIAQRIANHKSRQTTERYHVWGESPIVQQKIAEYAERFMSVTGLTACPPNEGVHQEEGWA